MFPIMLVLFIKMEISWEIRQLVMKQRNEGESLRELGEIINCNQSIAQKITNNYKEVGFLKSKIRSARPNKVRNRELMILRSVHKNPSISAQCC